ncbi:MAG: hypothetical protein ACRDHD_04735 [Candidatus Limnocylindria bacterium]
MNALVFDRAGRRWYLDGRTGRMHRLSRRRLLVAGIGLVTAAVSFAVMGQSNIPLHGQVESERPVRLFSDGLVRFEYPADWRILAEDFTYLHYEWVPVVLGTASTGALCQPHPAGGARCGIGTVDLGPGETLVVISNFQGLHGLAEGSPPQAFELPTGLLATARHTSSSSTWHVYAPGLSTPFVVEARYEDPGSETSRSQIDRLVASLRLTIADSGVDDGRP